MGTSSEQFDLVIIGAGFSGLAALRQALKKNLKVALIDSGSSASQHFSGAFDVIDPRWQDFQLMPQDYPSLRLAIDRFIGAHPQHLYAELAEHLNDFSETLIHEAQGFFDFYNIPIKRDDKLLMCFGSAGRPKPAAFALSTQALLNTEVQKRPPAYLLDVPYLKDYSEQAQHELKPYFDTVTVCRWSEAPAYRMSSLAQLSRDMDNGLFEKLLSYLKPLVKSQSVLILPPILGLERFQENYQRLQQELNCHAVEMLSVLPSISGIRFNRLLEKFWEKNKITIFKDEVIGFEPQQDKVVAVKTAHQTIKARQFCLATGKYLGGGVKNRRGLAESIFDLPLWVDGQVVTSQVPMTRLIQDQALTSQSYMRAGVKADDEGRPLPKVGKKAVYQNLTACGHVLAGFDFTRERCGFGVSLASALRFS